MTGTAPPLADQFASLRVALAISPNGGWLPSSLHALILACLARIFDRLEQLLTRWPANTLAPLPIRPQAINPRETSNPRAHRPHPGQRAQRRAHSNAQTPAPTAPAISAPAISTPAISATDRAAPPVSSSITSSPAKAPARRPRTARDPPPRAVRPMQAPPTGSDKHIQIVTI